MILNLVFLAATRSRGLEPEIRKRLLARTFCLTFHDIIPERTPESLWFDCSVSEFEAELNWLTQRGSHFVSIDQLYRHLTSGSPLPSHAVCITFADNYLGFYRYAVPILEKRRIPVTMFVHTGFVGSPIGRPKMDWAQLQELSGGNLISIESQTVSHPPDLRRLSSERLNREMSESKRDLQVHLHRPILYIAYPNGKFDAACERAAARAGYRMGFSEVLSPAEASPSIFSVARYVHTKFKRAWADANR